MSAAEHSDDTAGPGTAGATGTSTDERRPAAAGSALAVQRASLADRRRKVVESLHIDLPVPRLDPPVWVRYRPHTDAEAERIQKASEKSKMKDRTVISNASLLATCCVGVFEVIDGREVSVDPEDRDGDWPTFDDDLARLLGVHCPTAADVVRALYLTDGDVDATTVKVSQFSGHTLRDIEERIEGE